jgi:hypothetical protein
MLLHFLTEQKTEAAGSNITNYNVSHARRPQFLNDYLYTQSQNVIFHLRKIYLSNLSAPQNKNLLYERSLMRATARIFPTLFTDEIH